MNNTNNTDLHRTFLSVVFITEGIVIAPTIFGNLLLIYCIKRYKALHARSYILIGSLAVSDLLFGLLFLPYDMLTVAFPIMREYKITCLLRAVLLYGLVGASNTNIFIISLERHIALTYPLWHLKLSWRWLAGSIAVAWIMPLLMAVLPVVGWNSWNVDLKCVYKWKDAISSSFLMLWSYSNVSLLVISCILFFKVVFTTFSFLNNKSPQRGQFGVQRQLSVTRRTSIEKTKVLILIVGFFVLCWGPYCLLIIVKPFIQEQSKQRKQIDMAEKYSGFLAVCNCTLNWVIYGLKNKRIRHTFKLTLCGRRSRHENGLDGISTISSKQEQFSQLSCVK